MTESEYWYNRSSQDQIYSDAQSQAKMDILRDKQDYQLFTMLKPELRLDGNQWCVLYGKDLQEGIAGFGSTPHEAIINWNKQFHSKIA